MSDNILFEIQLEIIKRLPVKSLIQFRSVSKQWKSLIDSPKFIADYCPHRHNHRMLLRYRDSSERISKYVSVVDDESFPQHKFPMTLPVSVLSQVFLERDVYSSTSQGLVCFFIYDKNYNVPLTISMTEVLWNPAIKKSVVVPNVLFNSRNVTFIGFGVSPHTNDPMFVKITYINRANSDTVSCIPWHVEVFRLSTGVCRSLCTNLPHKFIEFSSVHVAIDRFIYWIGEYVEGGVRKRNMIMSFDMEREEFKELSLPECLTCLHPDNLNISKLRESLVVLETDEDAVVREHAVWIMEHGGPNSFGKLYTIKAPDASIGGTLFGFRKSGEPIIERSLNVGGRPVTSVYDTCSQCFNDIVIFENACLRYVSSYTDTLLLLDH